MKLSDTEWIVMNAVWQESPVSARDVLEQTSDQANWAYTTVKTILARLVEKGALREKKRANTSMYEPLVERGQAQRAAVRSLLDKAFGGTFGSLVHYMVADEKLSKKDREALTSALESLRIADKGKRG